MHRMNERAPIARWRVAVAAIGVTGMVLAACSSDDESTSAPTAATAAADNATTGGAATTTGAETTVPDSATAGADSETTVDDSVTASTDSEATTGQSTETTTAESGDSGELDCHGPKASGESVKIGVVWPEGPAISQPELGTAANAARSYANDCLGGIGGRPIEYVECPIDESNPATATNCANEIVEAKAAAMLVTVTAQGQTMVPIITGAGMPYVGIVGASPAESIDTSGLVFMLTPGIAGSLAAMAQVAKDDGIDKVGMVITENAAQGVGGLAQIPFAKAGVALNIVPVAPGTPDVTAQVASALDGAGAVAVIGDKNLCISFLQATQTLDPDGRHMILSTCVDPAVIEAVGDDALDKALMFTTAVPTSDDAEAVLYQQVMAKYAPETGGTLSAVQGYQSALAFFRGLGGLSGDVTPATIAAALAATTDLALPAGAGATYGCTTRPIALFPTACSAQTIYATMDGSTPSDPTIIDAAPLFAG